MATYLIKQEITITRQEGDNADLEIKVPSELSLTNASIIFEVKDIYGNTLISKSLTDGIVKSGQDVTITLLPEDTTGNSGTQKWELQLNDQSSYKIVTVGKGKFIINKEIIV